MLKFLGRGFDFDWREGYIWIWLNDAGDLESVWFEFKYKRPGQPDGRWLDPRSPATGWATPDVEDSGRQTACASEAAMEEECERNPRTLTSQAYGAGVAPWATPQAHDAANCRKPRLRRAKRTGRGIPFSLGLPEQARLAGWPTPQATDAFDEGPETRARRGKARGGADKLCAAAQLVALPPLTPDQRMQVDDRYRQLVKECLREAVQAGMESDDEALAYAYRQAEERMLGL